MTDYVFGLTPGARRVAEEHDLPRVTSAAGLPGLPSGTRVLLPGDCSNKGDLATLHTLAEEGRFQLIILGPRLEN